MPSWNSRGLRGSTLEELINLTNEKYRSNHLALINKVPTPIKPIKIDSSNRQITLAYFEQKSTVDYIGVVQGIPVCFDAKECATDTFPLQNIHEHQVDFMSEFERQNGVAFLIIYFKKRDVFYYLTYEKMMEFWNRSLQGGINRFHYEDLDPHYQISTRNGVFVHYLEMLNQDLENRD